MEEKEISGSAPQENKMGVQPIGRLLAGMAIPMMISMLVQALYNVVDSMFVAQLSQDAFNAVSLAFPIQNLMIAVACGVAVGINSLLSRSLGEKRQDMVDHAAGTGLCLSLCIAVIFAVLGLLFGRVFFLAQTKNAAIVEYGTQYLQVCTGLSVGLFLQFCFERFLQGTGRTSLSMVIQLVGAVLNIILDPILIFGLWGFPKLEVLGAAVATVTGQILAAVLGLFLNLWKNPDVHLRWREVRIHPQAAREIFRVGVPTAVMQSIGSIMVFGMNKILISFTEAATAVLGAYFKLQSFIFMPVFGLNNAMVPIIAYNYGAVRPERVKRTVKLTLGTAITIMTVGLLLFQFGTTFLLKIFNPSQEMVEIGITALRIVSLTFPFAGVCIVSCAVFQAIGNPVHSLVAASARQLLVLLPAAWLLAQTGKLDLVWLAFVVAEFVSFGLSVFFLRRTLKTAQAQMEARQA